jgi:hypothetical protein
MPKMPHPVLGCTEGEKVMTRLLIAAALVLFALPCSAQTVELAVDLASLGVGAIDAEPIETDGDQATREWLIYGTVSELAPDNDPDVFGNIGEPATHSTPRWYVLAVRSGGHCLGSGFDPRAYGLFPRVAIVSGVNKLIAVDHTGGQPGIFRVVSLDTPVCQ